MDDLVHHQPIELLITERLHPLQIEHQPATIRASHGQMRGICDLQVINEWGKPMKLSG
jgi:hypothetical protein